MATGSHQNAIDSAGERFEISIFNRADFSQFVEVVPMNTGFLAPHDSSLSAYVMEIDLSDFGLSPNETTQSIRLRLVDHLVSRSADPTAVGALNSLPVPEPSIGALCLLGLVGLACKNGPRHLERVRVNHTLFHRRVASGTRIVDGPLQ